MTLNITNDIHYFYGFWIMLLHLSNDNVYLHSSLPNITFTHLCIDAPWSWEFLEHYASFTLGFPHILGVFNVTIIHHQHLVINSRALKHDRGTNICVSQSLWIYPKTRFLHMPCMSQDFCQLAIGVHLHQPLLLSPFKKRVNCSFTL